MELMENKIGKRIVREVTVRFCVYKGHHHVISSLSRNLLRSLHALRLVEMTVGDFSIYSHVR